MKKKVLWITGIPSPYRVDFYNELGKNCELTVLFELSYDKERDNTWKDYRFHHFCGIFLHGLKTSHDSAFSLEVIKYLKRGDIIAVHGYSSLTEMVAIHYLKTHGIQYYLEADGAMIRDDGFFKQALKKYLISGAKGYFSSSKGCDDYFLRYGGKPDNIYRYPFTSLFQKDILSSPVSKQSKMIIKDRIGISEQFVIISVGRFSYMNGYGKGFDTLLKISESLPEDIGIYIIGDEPTEEFKQWKANKKLNHVHFLSFMQKKELALYYQAADLSVLLSRGEAWGLFVNESMANGIPVVTTNACVAGLELIENGKNGYLVDIDSVKEVTDIIISVYRDELLLNRLSMNAIEKIRAYTIEQMVLSHTRVFL